MKIAVIGSGGVGGYFGARLQEGGNDVRFIARGEHLSKMNRDGLKVLSQLGNLHLTEVKCTSNPQEIGQVDLVLIAVKLWSTDEAIAIIEPLLGPNTVIISLQNGVIAIDTLLARFQKKFVAGGVSQIAALIESPGVIRHNGEMAALIFGELDGKESSRLRDFLKICQHSNINAQLSDDIQTAIWEKFVLLVTMSSITALTRLPIGPNRNDPDTRELMIGIMKEVIAVAKKKGAKFPPDILNRQVAKIDSLPESMVASMCGDLRRHHKLELPWFAGAVAQLGKELKIPTPNNNFVYSALKLHKDGKHPMLQV